MMPMHGKVAVITMQRERLYPSTIGPSSSPAPGSRLLQPSTKAVPEHLVSPLLIPTLSFILLRDLLVISHCLIFLLWKKKKQNIFLDSLFLIYRWGIIISKNKTILANNFFYIL